MDTKSHRINLTQKRKAETGQWQFYPVQWDGNKPDPRLILIDGEPASWKGGGAFFLDRREGGKRTRKKVGKTPREALDAWRKASGVANSSIRDDEDETTDGSTDTSLSSTTAGSSGRRGTGFGKLAATQSTQTLSFKLAQSASHSPLWVRFIWSRRGSSRSMRTSTRASQAGRSVTLSKRKNEELLCSNRSKIYAPGFSCFGFVFLSSLVACLSCSLIFSETD